MLKKRWDLTILQRKEKMKKETSNVTSSTKERIKRAFIYYEVHLFCCFSHMK